MPIALPPKVMPGDPIRSATTNALIDAIAALDRRTSLTGILAIPLGPTTIPYGVKKVYIPFRDTDLGNDPAQVLGWPMPFKARITNMTAHVVSNSLNGATAITLYVNETSTLLAIQINAGETGTKANQINEVIADAGARLSILVDTAGSTSGEIVLTGVSMAYRLETEE